MSDATETLTDAEREYEIKRQLLEIADAAKDASLLLHTGFKLRHPTLFADATKVFGSWESALTELVILMRDKEDFVHPSELPQVPEGGPQSDELYFPDREAATEASEPILGMTSQGELVVMDGDTLQVAKEPQTLSTQAGHFTQLSHQGPKADLILFSKGGSYFGVVHDFLPGLASVESGQSIRTRLELAEGDRLFYAVSRNQFHPSSRRLYHVTRAGKAKATDLTDISLQFGRAGKEAFLLKDDDQPIAVLIGDAFEGLFCASALGQGIHMSTGDIRSMGRKSVGVNVMKLNANGDDAVVSAFFTEGVEDVAVMTAEGYGKRVAFREFRRQGRGGTGMQVLRLNAQDKVIGVTPFPANGDLVFTTNLERYCRFPASALPQMGRPARGKRLFELREGEQIIALSALPCGGNPAPIATPIAMEEPIDDPGSSTAP